MKNGDQELGGWPCTTLTIFTGNGERLRLHVRRPGIDHTNVMKGGEGPVAGTSAPQHPPPSLQHPKTPVSLQGPLRAASPQAKEGDTSAQRAPSRVNTSPSNTLGGTWAGAFHPRVGRGWGAGRDAKPRVTTETGEGVRGWCIGRKVPLGEPPPPVTATQTLSASPLSNHRSCGSGEDALILSQTMKSGLPCSWKTCPTLDD